MSQGPVAVVKGKPADESEPNNTRLAYIPVKGLASASRTELARGRRAALSVNPSRLGRFRGKSAVAATDCPTRACLRHDIRPTKGALYNHFHPQLTVCGFGVRPERCNRRCPTST